MSEQKTFTQAVVACLISNAPDDLEPQRAELTALVARVLDEVSEQQPDRLNPQPSRQQIDSYLDAIRAVLPAKYDHIALVNGGATKIKGYVFEAPKLPEIRGASALLDWVNEVGLPKLWGATSPEQFVEKGIIYASGGGFLAFASADKGQDLATAIERCYTEHTLTANSVAVTETFSLLELRYGRLNIKENKLPYWIDEFTEQWKNPAFQRQLAHYYYSDKPEETPADRFYRRKTFGELVTLLATMTNRRREERARYGEVRSVPFYPMTPWAQKCQTSDIRPAVVIAQGLPNNPAMSQTAAKKAYAGRKMKRSNELHKWYIETFGDDVHLPTSWEDRFKEHAAKTDYYTDIPEKDVFPAQDVSEIAQASHPDGYIGIIYADGNNVGRRVAVAATPHGYQKLSNDLDDASCNAVFAALAEHVRPTRVLNDQGQRKIIHPFEIITIGGDDILLIVPGSKALDIALSIGRNFENGFADLQKQPTSAQSVSSDQVHGRYKAETSFTYKPYTPSIGLSAGVIIAQENAPIFFLRDLVEELLKSAKELAKKNAKQGFYGGAVDFMVMKSITMVTDKIKSFRRQALGDDGKYSERRLTARPYTWHEFAGLLDTVRALKTARVPRSQLHRLRRALDAEAGAGITSSVMEYLYTRVRISKAYGEALQKHIEQPWCWATPVDNRTGGLPPWMPLDKKGWETIWPDLLEAYEMVPEKEQQ